MAPQTEKLTTITLNDNNYLSWVRAMKLALGGRGRDGLVTRENPKPEISDPPTTEQEKALKKWQMQDDEVMTWLINSMEPHIYDLCMHLESSQETWEYLKDTYDQQDNFSHIYNLKQEISQIRQNNRSNSEYLSDLKKKLQELKIYLPPTTDPKEIQQRAEQDEIYLYLSGLNPSYESMRSHILMSADLPPFNKVVSMIQRDESRRKGMVGSQANIGEEPESHALAAKSLSQKKYQNPRKRGADEKCEHCKKSGHKIDDCWFVHPSKAPIGWVIKGDNNRKGEIGDRWGGASSGSGASWGRNNSGANLEKKNENASGGKGFVTQNIFDPIFEAEPSCGSQGGGSNGSGQEDHMQQMLQQFSVWFSKQNNSNFSGPGNREDDW